MPTTEQNKRAYDGDSNRGTVSVAELRREHGGTLLVEDELTIRATKDKVIRENPGMPLDELGNPSVRHAVEGREIGCEQLCHAADEANAHRDLRSSPASELLFHRAIPPPHL